MAPLSRGVMSVFCNVIKPQGLEPFQFSTKISSPSSKSPSGDSLKNTMSCKTSAGTHGACISPTSLVNPCTETSINPTAALITVDTRITIATLSSKKNRGPNPFRILVKIKLPTSGGYVVYCSRATKPRAGSYPCWKVRGGRAGPGRAQSPRVGGVGVAGHRLRGRCAGVGSDRAGAPDDSARPAGAGTWRPVHRASAPCGRGAPAPRARAAGPSGRPGGVGRSADPGRPHVALALDVQESREAGRGAGGPLVYKGAIRGRRNANPG